MDRPEQKPGPRSSISPFVDKDRQRASGPGREADEETLPAFSLAEEPERQRAADVLKEIGDEFNRLRESNRTSAFGALQKKLWANVAVLVPYAVTLKDFIGLSVSIEDFIKSDTGTTAKEPLEVIREFLDAPAAPTKAKVH